MSLEQCPAPSPRFLQELLDKQAITEVIYLRSRASDRSDTAAALSCYHEGATEVHPGSKPGGAREFVLERHEMSKNEASPYFYMMFHGLLNILIEVDGDNAFSETYNIALVRRKEGDGATETEIGGRILDRFERRDGRWAIVHREIVMDWSRTQPVGAQFWDTLVDGVVLGARGASDPLYKYIDPPSPM